MGALSRREHPKTKGYEGFASARTKAPNRERTHIHIP